MDALRDYFERHPDRYAITMVGAVVFLAASLMRLVRADSTGKRVGAAVLTAIAVAEVAGLAAERPRSTRQDAA